MNSGSGIFPRLMLIIFCPLPWLSPSFGQEGCTGNTLAVDCLTKGMTRIQDGIGRLEAIQDQLKSLQLELKAQKDKEAKDVGESRDYNNKWVNSIRSPRLQTQDCGPGSCTASCASDEILITGLCIVPGPAENGTGYAQNVGYNGGNGWNCVLGALPSPQYQPLKAVRAHAWCAKIPR
jgi:hypothetical protein